MLGQYCSLLAVVSLCGSASDMSRSRLSLGNNLVLLQTQKARVVSSIFPAFTVSAIKS